MPRKYQPVTERKHADCPPHILKLAVTHIQNGLSYRKCSQKYNIPTTVLHRHVKKGDKIKKKGGQTVLSEEEEKILVDRLQVCAEWGYPLDSLTLRLIVKDFLERQGKNVPRFKDNTPGRDFVYSFLERHKEALSARMCQNIKRARAAVSHDVISKYFDELEKELMNVPPSHIINFDETNLSDDPGKRKLIFRRGCKYPERVLNSSKASISVMFAASGDGKILPPYVVYRAQHLYDSWRVGGPQNSRYNRTKSGWFDSFCFSDWVETIAIPYLKKLDGTKYLIGDNLASHLSVDIIQLCNINNIKFIFLPTNSTHLTQPLDVAFFRPMKNSWRQILEEWKKGPGRNEASVPKDKFPGLLKKLVSTLKEDNVRSGFRKCGIVPLCRNKVLQMLPSIDSSAQSETQSTQQSPAVQAIDSTFKELLKSLRQSDSPKTRQKRRRVTVIPGKSMEVKDFEESAVVSEPGPSGLETNGRKLAGGAPTKKTKIPVITESSSSDDSDYCVQESDEYTLQTNSEEEPRLGTHVSHVTPVSTSVHHPGDYLVVKVYGKSKNVFRLYVCKVMHPEDDG
ncbi:uncharacterized protein LOC134536584 [Bacillus rossius redtenbacheri]|uniref:uncharacterized protein LOC134536584 n=1 Tax=Bacillus rossius redtenbacheri TaxID=93214 RepID=UPI002FDE42C4